MIFADIDLTPVLTALAGLLQGTGPYGMIAGAVLLFVAQLLGGHKFNLSGFLASLFKPATAQDKLIAELKAKLEAKVRAAVSPTMQTVVTSPPSHPADEFLKWVHVIENPPVK